MDTNTDTFSAVFIETVLYLAVAAVVTVILVIAIRIVINNVRFVQEPEKDNWDNPPNPDGLDHDNENECFFTSNAPEKDEADNPHFSPEIYKENDIT